MEVVVRWWTFSRAASVNRVVDRSAGTASPASDHSACAKGGCVDTPSLYAAPSSGRTACAGAGTAAAVVSRGSVWPWCLAVLCGAAASGAIAQGQGAAPPTSVIYTCTNDDGQRLTSDRPIRDCIDRPQRILNPDGSQKGVLQPTLTAQERAAKRERERQEAEVAAARAEAQRRDRNLIQRFPDEAAHRAARDSALAPIRLAMDLTSSRLSQLVRERRPIDEEIKALGDKPVPPALRERLDANDAATSAQRDLSVTQKAEYERITRQYDAELARLRRLWAGEKAEAPSTSAQAATPAAVATPAAAPANRKP